MSAPLSAGLKLLSRDEIRKPLKVITLSRSVRGLSSRKKLQKR